MSSSGVLKHRIITLTTDFGLRDPFVGEMKGVILSINPSAVLTDITHGIGPQNIEEGAFVIGSVFHYFPPKTIHVAVIDPGVGSGRRPIIVEASGQYFVGPDNGLFSYVMAYSPDFKVVHIVEDKYFLTRYSSTFQGRDVFAPVAARMTKGMKIAEFGPVIHDPVRFEIPLPVAAGGRITGEVIYIDGFGNAITNIRINDLSSFGADYTVETTGRIIRPLIYYSQATDNDLHCLVNSSGYLELFVNMGSALRSFNIARGEKVTVSLSKPVFP